jgi:hypothetical protein
MKPLLSFPSGHGQSTELLCYMRATSTVIRCKRPILQLSSSLANISEHRHKLTSSQLYSFLSAWCFLA